MKVTEDKASVTGEFKEAVENNAVEESSVEDERVRRLSRSLIRKLDMTLMPIIWIMYVFNYLDRNNISAAKLDNFEKDLGLKGEQFNTAVSILNVGYLLMQLPSNMILTRVRPSRYLPFWICVWSCISASTSVAKNYESLIVIRFFLGVADAPFFPGAVYLLSCWYTKREMALRTALLNTGLILATAFSGLIAAGVFSGLGGARGLAGWRWMLIIEGAASFAIGLVAFALLPDFPGSKAGSGAWLLTQEERDVAVLRLERGRNVESEEGKSVWYGLKLAVTDWHTWTFSLMLLANHASYGFNYFYPTITQGFHLGSTTITLVLTAPPYLLATCISLVVAFSSDRLGERGWHISIPTFVAAIGFIISAVDISVPVRYFASFLFVCGCFSVNAGVFSWVSSTVNQTPEKRAAAIAIINLLAQLGNIISPYFFRSKDAPRYVLAMSLMTGFAGLTIVTCLVMKWSLGRKNARLLEAWDGSGSRPKLYTL